GRGHRCSSTATCRSTTSSSKVTRSPASSTGPRRPRATPCSTSPPSRSDTRSTLATLSLATAPTSTSTSSAPGGRCDACLGSAGWSSTATARPRSIPRSPCCDHGYEGHGNQREALTWGFTLERVTVRVTGIEPALSAWEVCDALALPPAGSVTRASDYFGGSPAVLLCHGQRPVSST